MVQGCRPPAHNSPAITYSCVSVSSPRYYIHMCVCPVGTYLPRPDVHGSGMSAACPQFPSHNLLLCLCLVSTLLHSYVCVSCRYIPTSARRPWFRDVGRLPTIPQP